MSKVLVLNMACAKGPGGGVRMGAGAQEEDLFRRTDMSRHSAPYYKSTPYPLADSDPITAMITEGVTVLRGSEKKGYPFF